MKFCVCIKQVPDVTAPIQIRDGELSMGFIDIPYSIDNLRCESCDARNHVRIGWLRDNRKLPWLPGVVKT
ncbi:MAG: hypothetical protein IIA27_15820 [Gemmatimonadetes bacterium]|nr:hypothetical protein [Gemmatimonadota bacterium]